MPTQQETAIAIRSAANVNQAAIDSVVTQAQTHLAAVDDWAPASTRSQMRDALNRTIQGLRSVRSLLATNSRLADVILDGGGGPDVPPAPITWSTGAW